MKKVWAIGLAILLVFSLASCVSSKTALSADEFQSRMTAAGYEVSDALSQFPEGAAEAVLLATKEDYQIEFYVVPTVEQAISAFNENKDNFEAEKGSSSSHTSVSLGNYSEYKLTSNGQYYVVSRVENTFIYVVTTDKNKASVNDALKTLGY